MNADLKSAHIVPDTFPNQYAEQHLYPTTLFELFNDDDILQMIIDNSIKHAMQKGKHSFSLDLPEL